MIGQWLLRRLYRRGLPLDYYSGFASLIDGKTILDVGGGAGDLYSLVSSNTFYYILLDVDEELLKVARRRHRGVSFEIVRGDAHRLPLRSRCCSVVLHDALHHFSDPVGALREAARVVDQCIYIRDPDSSSIGGKILMFVEKLMGFPGRGLTMDRVVELFETMGFRVVFVERKGVQYTVKACRPSAGHAAPATR